jgi:hypothetical protein
MKTYLDDERAININLQLVQNIGQRAKCMGGYMARPGEHAKLQTMCVQFCLQIFVHFLFCPQVLL